MALRSVLIVDDNLLLLELFKCYAMSSADIDLSCAASLDDAIDVIAKKQPEAILLDNRLTPYNNFIETVPILRESGYRGNIIVISANIDDQIFDDYHCYSVSSCLDKFDFNYSNFDKVVNRVLS